MVRSTPSIGSGEMPFSLALPPTLFHAEALAYPSSSAPLPPWRGSWSMSSLAFAVPPASPASSSGVSPASWSPPTPASWSNFRQPPSTPASWSDFSPPPPTYSSLATSLPNDSEQAAAKPVGLVAGLSVSAVVVIALVIAGVLLWRRKRIRNRRATDQLANHSSRDKNHVEQVIAHSPSNPERPFLKLAPSSPPQIHPPTNKNDGSDPRTLHHSSSGNIQSMQSFGQVLTYEELYKATNGFSEENLLGQGGFGFVHKGILSNGKEVAVKQLKTDSKQGDREFHAEVEIISRVHHKHLVSLVGYCIHEKKRLLVYEYVPNKTLEFHLHGEGQPSMEWSRRLKIALGSAKGLAYLHEECNPKIIHRDIKAANILVDSNYEAKVADFGLAKFSANNNTHVSTRVMGTFGYLAPEYAASGKLTEKSDVYSFGVMLLELITGRPPTAPIDNSARDSLVDWLRPLLLRSLQDGKFGSFVDPKLQENYNTDEMKSMVACALACSQQYSQTRPQMTQVVRVLEGVVPINCLYDDDMFHKGNLNSHPDGVFISPQNSDDMKAFWKLTMSSRELTSTEYSTTSGEYVQNLSGFTSNGR